jgi:hypothetical protein
VSAVFFIGDLHLSAVLEAIGKLGIVFLIAAAGLIAVTCTPDPRIAPGCGCVINEIFGGAERRANTPDATESTMTTTQRATSDEGTETLSSCAVKEGDTP